jgi:penicillin-binding protein 2
MGLGATCNIGLAEEKAGVIPDPDWKRGNLNAAWLGGETLLTGLGQGYMQATPLQLAVMAARVASGRAVAPVLQKRDASSAKQAFGELAFGMPHLDVVRAGMTAVINEKGGTAEQAKLGDGNPVLAGKTGASQISSRPIGGDETSIEWTKRDHALFVGYEPAEAPRYAIATVVEHGGDGGALAALLARDVINLAIGRDRAARDKTGAQGRSIPFRSGNAQEAG